MAQFDHLLYPYNTFERNDLNVPRWIEIHKKKSWDDNGNDDVDDDNDEDDQKICGCFWFAWVALTWCW